MQFPLSGITLFTIVGGPISIHIQPYPYLTDSYGGYYHSYPIATPKSSKAGHLLRYVFIVSRFLPFFCSFQWISLRENLQESPMIFMEKVTLVSCKFSLQPIQSSLQSVSPVFFQRLQLEIPVHQNCPMISW